MPATATDTENEEPSTPTESGDEDPVTTRARDPSEPPVQAGESREVDIEDIGNQGDGIARVERGYVIIVSETERGDRVTIEITTVRENVAFGDVVDQEEYFQ